MKPFDWMRAGPAVRGTPPRRHLPWRKLIAVGLLGVFALSETGCRSGGCGSCGFLRRTTSRVFNRSARIASAPSGGCCGDSVVGETFVGEAPVSSGVIVPGPAGSIPSSPTIIEDSPTSLAPIPEGKPKARVDDGKQQGSTRLVPKLGYDTARPAIPAGRPRAGNDLAKTSATNPVPASRSARGSSVESQFDTDNPLDHLPPLDLPTEVTERSQTPPVAPAAEKSTAPDKLNAPSAAKNAEMKPKEPEKTTGNIPSLPPDNSVAASGAPGIQRLVSLDLKLAGGSAPTRDGLDWLAEKGYKTILDLRERSEVEPSFMDDVISRGMRYIPMPMNVKSLDANHVARFNFELSVAEAKPLFFFDSDGTRPGALWYVRRITKDSVDSQIAHREAEDIGLTDKSSFWLAARAYVDKAEAAKIGQLPRDPGLDPEAKPVSSTIEEPKKSGKNPSASIEVDAPAEKLARAEETPEGHIAQLDPTHSVWLVDTSKPFKNRAEWHPIAAVMMTGLTVPIAYWSRSIFPLVFTKPTASLTATARPSKSLPGSSGE